MHRRLSYRGRELKEGIFRKGLGDGGKAVTVKG
jgi:hypothetical protein